MSPVAGAPLSVYVHLPWCVRKCPYCDFNSHTAGDAAPKDDYLDALRRDIDRDAAMASDRRVDTVFIGGGTPSLFSPRQVGEILEALADRLTLPANAEITMEANPGTVERGSLRGYRQAGVNRLSIGAQSFDDEMLRRLGRIHGRAEIVSAVREARAGGFDNVNLDVMFGLPGQSVEGAVADVRAAVELDPEHLSHYQLTLEPNTVFSARPPAGLPDDDLGWAMQTACHDELVNAGFERYEVSAFARPGRACRHNLNYWTYGDYLGLGAGAHGLVTEGSGRRLRTEKPANPRQYIEDMARDPGTGRFREVSAEDAIFEFMLNVLRLPGGFELSTFERRTGVSAVRLRGHLDAARERGLLAETNNGMWQPTERGFRFLNDLQAMFLPSEFA